MAAHSPSCPNCSEPVDYWTVICRCGHSLGFPNRRAAAAEGDELAKRYNTARQDASTRNVAPLLAKLEALAEGSKPVISMSFQACDDILRSGKYLNYYQMISSSRRMLATRLNHSDRGMVGEKLFPGFKEHIQYAALSTNGRGLSSYGKVAIRWEVTSAYLCQRISVHEENSYTFFDRHGLGRLGATIPSGYQSIWEERGTLVATKLAKQLTTATAESSLSSLLMHAGSSREDDEYVEICIYEDKGLDTRDVDMVTFLIAPTTPDERHRSELVRGSCATRATAIRVVE